MVWKQPRVLHWVNGEAKYGLYTQRNVTRLQKEGHSDSGYSMDEPRGHCAQGKGPVTKVPGGVKFTDAESGRVAARVRAVAGRMGHSCLLGTDLPFGKKQSFGAGWR